MSGAAVARAVRVLRVVAADHAGAPVEAVVGRPALEDAVDAAHVLLLRAPVVDDDVGDALDAPAVERRDQGLKLRRRAVLRRVQVVQAPRHVTCRRLPACCLILSYKLKRSSANQDEIIST